MKYLSVCSGMEAASVAWHPLGWTPVGFSEIEPFPCAILKHRFPNVPNYGDLTKYAEWSRISWKGKPEDQCPDGPRYKACGNSMAVPVMRWIGNRIAQHEAKA
jgi:site-specific DNA-cytosine methylase